MEFTGQPAATAPEKGHLRKNDTRSRLKAVSVDAHSISEKAQPISDQYTTRLARLLGRLLDRYDRRALKKNDDRRYTTWLGCLLGRWLNLYEVPVAQQPKHRESWEKKSSYMEVRLEIIAAHGGGKLKKTYDAWMALYHVAGAVRGACGIGLIVGYSYGTFRIVTFSSDPVVPLACGGIYVAAAELLVVWITARVRRGLRDRAVQYLGAQSAAFFNARSKRHLLVEWAEGDELDLRTIAPTLLLSEVHDSQPSGAESSGSTNAEDPD